MRDSPADIVTLRQSYPKPAPTPTVGRASRPPPGRPRPVSTRRATRHGSADSVGMLNEGQRATHCSTNLLGISTDRLPRPARRRPTFIPTYRELTLAATRKSYQTNPSPQPGYLRIRSYRDGDAAGAMTMIKDRDRAPASSWRKRARAGGGDSESAERIQGASPILVPSRWRSPRQGGAGAPTAAACQHPPPAPGPPRPQRSSARSPPRPVPAQCWSRTPAGCRAGRPVPRHPAP